MSLEFNEKHNGKVDGQFLNELSNL